ncbi:hypothetical protein [Streptomyces sp. NPDC056549]|uniref:hypothetical protein n=1 Tax=Streptomyces sp. NPDC056549 TaxID=3345864 RepID=UPI0036832419
MDAEQDFGAHGRFDDRARRRSRQQLAAHALGTPCSLRRRWCSSAPSPVITLGGAFAAAQPGSVFGDWLAWLTLGLAAPYAAIVTQA